MIQYRLINTYTFLSQDELSKENVQGKLFNIYMVRTLILIPGSVRLPFDVFKIQLAKLCYDYDSFLIFQSIYYVTTCNSSESSRIFGISTGTFFFSQVRYCHTTTFRIGFNQLCFVFIFF